MLMLPGEPNGLAMVVALASNTGDDPLTWLVNFGVAGVVIILFVTGQIRTKSEVTALEKRIAQQDEIIKEFQNQITSHTLPALASSTRVLEAIPTSETAVLSELRRVRADAEALVARLEAAARGDDDH